MRINESCKAKNFSLTGEERKFLVVESMLLLAARLFDRVAVHVTRFQVNCGVKFKRSDLEEMKFSSAEILWLGSDLAHQRRSARR